MLMYLIEIFGKKNVEKFELNISNLPIYMHSYSYEFVLFYNQKIALMRSQKLNINSYLHHSKLIYERYGVKTVLVLEKSKKAQRNNLIQNNLMFIEKNRYIFMPFIGVVFDFSSETQNENISELTYKDFHVSLGFIYLNKKILNVNELCNFTSSNKMTVFRALKKLMQFGLIEETTSKKLYLYKLAVTKIDYINKLLLIMKSPIKLEVLIGKKDIPSSAVFSGITALSKYTMINDDKVNTYAIYRDEYEKVKNLTEDYMDGIIIPNDKVKLQIWNYEPQICCKNNCAELISVVKTINDKDERVIQAIEEIKELVINE